MSATISSMRTQAAAQTFEHLSSGSRLNRAGDDPAGQGVADALTSRATSERQALRNINDGISVVQVAGGALDGASDMLSRMRELAVQASSGTLAAAGRDAIQSEYEQLADELDRVADTTEFNGVQLADGSQPSLDVQVGPDAGDAVSLDLPDVSAAGLGVDTASLDYSSAAGAQAAIGAIDAAIEMVSAASSELGASENRLGSALDVMTTEQESLTAASSRIQDTDFADAVATLASQQIMQDVDIALQAQANMSRASMMQLLG